MKKWKLDSYSEALLEDLFWKESEQQPISTYPKLLLGLWSPSSPSPKGTWFPGLKWQFVNTKPYHSLTNIWLKFLCKGKTLKMNGLYCPTFDTMEIRCQGNNKN